MPKIKTRKTIAKRFKKTGSGKLKRRRAGINHLAANKTHKRTRNNRKNDLVSTSDQKRIERALPY